jgi:hypothetical protein
MRENNAMNTNTNMIIKTAKKSKIILILLALLVFSGAASSCGASVAATSGNSTNYGYVLADGDDIYYTKIIVESESEIYSNIYKCSARNPDSEILISSMPAGYINHMNAFLSLDGGYLYFLAKFIHESEEEYSDNIYRIKPDGKNTVPEKLFEEDISCSFMYISNGVIYYYDDTDYAFYRMNTNGTKKQLLCEAVVTGAAVGGDKIYFAEFDVLMSVSVNGDEPKEIYNFEDDDIYIEKLILDGNYLYYLDDTYSLIGRIRTDGTDKKKIYEVSESSYAYIESLNVSGGVVYFVLDEYGQTENYAVLSITPGSKSTKLIVSDTNELGDIGPLSIWGDTIYFVGMPIYDTILDSDDVWFTVKKSGGKIDPFKPLNVFKNN